MNPDPLTIHIHKPLHGTYCSIRLETLNEAIRNHQLLRVHVADLGYADVDPVWWYETGKKEKRVMKYKNNPMTLIYNSVPLPSYAVKNKDVAVNQMSLL